MDACLGNEYVKYMTETLVKRWEMPKAERKLLRVDAKDARPSVLFQWFGSAPILYRDAIQKVHEVLARNLLGSCPQCIQGRNAF